MTIRGFDSTKADRIVFKDAIFSGETMIFGDRNKGFIVLIWFRLQHCTLLSHVFLKLVEKSMAYETPS